MKMIFAVAVALSVTISCTTRTIYVKIKLDVPKLDQQAGIRFIPTCGPKIIGECLSMDTKLYIGKRENIYRSNEARLIKRIEATH
jgi:hypothetical protein